MSAEIVLVIRILIAIFIYGFLALTIWSLWQTTFPSKIKQKEIPAGVVLTNIGNNESLSFSSHEIYIGRDENANFMIMDEAASNMHARIYRKDDQWWIEDLNSTNGTFLNQDKLVSPELIASEDTIQCGETLIKFAIGSEKSEGIDIAERIWR